MLHGSLANLLREDGSQTHCVTESTSDGTRADDGRNPANEPRTTGDVASMPSVQIGLLLLLLFVALLGLWIAWSLVSAG